MNLEPRTDGDLEPLRSPGMELATQLHAVTYVVINLMLVVIWALTSPGGYFWPIWPIISWAPALAIHGWLTYGRVRGD